MTIPQKRVCNMEISDTNKCLVCGDKPTGHHYDVLSCNGCKTFFRRTIIQGRQFYCSRDFRCVCRACRFDKCVAVGMNPASIQGIPVENHDYVDDEHISAADNLLKTEEMKNLKIFETIVQQEMAIQLVRNKNLPLIIYPQGPFSKLIDEPCFLDSGTLTKTTEAEQEQYRKNPVRYWMEIDLFLAIEFAKTFPEFQNLSKSDKIAFIHNVGPIVQTLTSSFYSLFHKSDSVTFPDGVNALYYKMVEQNSPNEKKVVNFRQTQFECYYRDNYCRPLEIIRNLNLTIKEFALVKSIALFSNETGLRKRAQHVIKRKRLELAHIFRKYLTTEHGLQAGLQKFALCLFTIKTFTDITEKRREYLFCVDVMQKAQLAPLLKCIYLRQSPKRFL